MFSIALFTSMEWWAVVCFLITVVVSYFLGNISPAILIGRMKGIDIKKEGSGNAGTTNVLRVLGKQAAAATL
ncbi:MAG: glycerol-3-phosphate acyltransferase, partial [Anaerovorax sp.]